MLVCTYGRYIASFDTMFTAALLVIASQVVLVASTAHYELLEEWNLWKEQHGKGYGSVREDLERHLVWLSNKKYIDAHNANSHIFGFTLAMNQFGDIPDTEFAEKYGTYIKPDYTAHTVNITTFKPKRGMSYPTTLDWKRRNAVTEVKTQGDCGSSYAFSTTGSIEGALALAYGELCCLSEQNIIDCSAYNGNRGCSGGNMYNSFWYVIENEGVASASGYPYLGKQSVCQWVSANPLTDISGIVLISSGNEYDLKAALATVGPVSVAVDARPKTFRFYSSGIYSTSQCSSTTLTHAMLVTGYGVTSGNKDYWIVKNSWGTDWGKDGYIKMARNSYNHCGIASDASYPTL